MEKKFLAIIPARGDSKRIPRKNIALLDGKPLIQYTIEAARGCPLIDRIVVSTEDAEVAEVAKALGAEVPCLRPQELAQDNTYTLPVLQHMMAYLQEEQDYQPWAVVTLQPTSPLRTSQHLTQAIELFLGDEQADSLVSVVQAPHNMIPQSLMKLEGPYLKNYLEQESLVLRSQDKPVLYARNGAAIYITRADKLKDYIFGGNTLHFIMPKMSSFDIDNLEDLKLIELLLKNWDYGQN